ncbi:hypothetical protein HNR16_001653 [Pseudoclavibacter chungangensis]|uniref:hypothetical protein n=1 Tax=Pseudoclavibacter chungangensis TaxID=587635 RepID=UPI0015C773B0|nr:hypothetical protein [Pseudoclavibacter chungangensis]NYJ66865.1 hypothetical protein [Pseudoclavibacter chungangensis]
MSEHTDDPADGRAPRVNGTTIPYRVVGTALTLVVVGGLGYGLVQTAIRASAIFTG